MRQKCELCEYGKWKGNIKTVKIKGKKHAICLDCLPLLKKAKRLLK